jgi:hypothetical protein
MSSPIGNPFDGMYNPRRSNISGIPFIPLVNPPRGMYSLKRINALGSIYILGGTNPFGTLNHVINMNMGGPRGLFVHMMLHPLPNIHFLICHYLSWRH